MTGYFRDGSRFLGRAMTPQMSVLPSRPLATNTSGGCPAACLEGRDVGLLELAQQRPVRGPAQLVDRRHVDTAVGVDEVSAIGRELHRVRAVSLGEGDEAGAVEVHPIVVDEVRILAGVLASRPEPDLPLLLIDQVDAADDVLAAGDRVLDLPLPGVDEVEMSPAVTLGGVEDLVRPVEPVDAVQIDVLRVCGPDERR